MSTCKTELIVFHTAPNRQNLWTVPKQLGVVLVSRLVYISLGAQTPHLPTFTDAARVLFVHS